jgi:hypothetical protein
LCNICRKTIDDNGESAGFSLCDDRGQGIFKVQRFALRGLGRWRDESGVSLSAVRLSPPERSRSNTRGVVVLKILTATVASLAMIGAAAAADLPRKEPPPPAPPVGKAPIGKYPVGKFPVGKYPQPQPVVTKG